MISNAETSAGSPRICSKQDDCICPLSAGEELPCCLTSVLLLHLAGAERAPRCRSRYYRDQAGQPGLKFRLRPADVRNATNSSAAVRDRLAREGVRKVVVRQMTMSTLTFAEQEDLRREFSLAAEVVRKAFRDNPIKVERRRPANLKSSTSQRVGESFSPSRKRHVSTNTSEVVLGGVTRRSSSGGDHCNRTNFHTLRFPSFNSD
jgi:hypothetical protein